MRFGYTIIYVCNVIAAVEFYERAFGLKRRFVDESGSYAEMDTGATTLAFADTALAKANGLHLSPASVHAAAPPIEICLVSDTPVDDYARAVAAGAQAITPVAAKPWGQQVGYVRDLGGVMVEICSPMAG